MVKQCFPKAMNCVFWGKILLLPLDHFQADMFLIIYVSSVSQFWKTYLIKAVSLMRVNFGITVLHT